MAHPPIGIANSVSYNFQYDPLDTLAFAKQSEFDPVQIYVNAAMLANPDVLQQLQSQQTGFQKVYFHAEGYLNADFSGSDYRSQLTRFVKGTPKPNYILHFDERVKIDDLVKIADQLKKDAVELYLENYFMAEGKAEAERNIKKYLALFTLTHLNGIDIMPVLDIPRLFHHKLGFETAEAVEWCYQMINFFGNRNIPLLLHLIDATAPEQGRLNFTAIGNGYIPYAEILGFIRKTRPNISGIILEFEDKINPLASREFIINAFADK